MEKFHHLSEARNVDVSHNDDIQIHEIGSRKSPIAKAKKKFSKAKYFEENGILDKNHHDKAMSFLESFMKHIASITHDPKFWKNKSKEKMKNKLTDSKRDVVLGSTTGAHSQEHSTSDTESVIGRIFEDDDNDDELNFKSDTVMGTTRTLKDHDENLGTGIITVLQLDEDEKVPS